VADSGKIRVGIVGLSPQRGFASIAHIPALHALSDFEIAAVCTTRQESADAAARHFGIALAFSNAEELARHPGVDLVTVTVKVPDHYRPVMAAINAGKHVYCEWPLGRNTAEAQQMLDAAERKGVRHAVGLQGQWSPTVDYVRDLVTDGYVGKVLTATLIGCAPKLYDWGLARRARTTASPIFASAAHQRQPPAHHAEFFRCSIKKTRTDSRRY